MKKIISDPQAVQKVIESFSRTTDQIYTLEELKKALLSGKQLRMKYGVDVTAPHMHIGHAVNLWMYRKLQELGHKIVFLIGDFTTQIGDPTGKSKTRPIIPESEIKKNAQEFIKQAMMVLIDDPHLVEVRRNSEWFSKMNTKEFLSLLSVVTHEKLMSRDMFRKRMEEGREIYMHEITYPILQGYDSVMLEADITIIGTDQLYNEMMGRFYQERYEQNPQIIITTKITPGIDGGEKQSKSLGNYIGLGHSPREKFGRVMSMADNLITQYLEVYTEVALAEIEDIKKHLASDPMKYKLMLAHEIVARYHGKVSADEELSWFKKTFSEREIPNDAPQVSLGGATASVFQIVKKCFGEDKSNTEIKRLIEQKAVRIGGELAKGPDESFSVPKKGLPVKIGKRNWFKIFP